MPEITFEVRGLDELARRMSEGPARLKISLNEGLRCIGKLIVPILKDETPVRTGKLRNTTVAQIIGSPDNQALDVRQAARSPQGAFYGWFVREGTGPHTIVPVRVRVLHFIIGGRDVFAMRVNHPGTKPNPYHKRALERASGGIQEIVDGMGEKVIAHLAGT